MRLPTTHDTPAAVVSAAASRPLPSLLPVSHGRSAPHNISGTPLCRFAGRQIRKRPTCLGYDLFTIRKKESCRAAPSTLLVCTPHCTEMHSHVLLFILPFGLVCCCSTHKRGNAQLQNRCTICANKCTSLPRPPAAPLSKRDAANGEVRHASLFISCGTARTRRSGGTRPPTSGSRCPRQASSLPG